MITLRDAGKFEKKHQKRRQYQDAHRVRNATRKVLTQSVKLVPEAHQVTYVKNVKRCHLEQQIWRRRQARHRCQRRNDTLGAVHRLKRQAQRALSPKSPHEKALVLALERRNDRTIVCAQSALVNHGRHGRHACRAREGTFPGFEPQHCPFFGLVRYVHQHTKKRRNHTIAEGQLHTDVAGHYGRTKSQVQDTLQYSTTPQSTTLTCTSLLLSAYDRDVRNRMPLVLPREVVDQLDAHGIKFAGCACNTTKSRATKEVHSTMTKESDKHAGIAR